jgi:hypothetical protein
MSAFYFLHLLDRPGAPVAQVPNDGERDLRLVEPGRVSEWVEARLLVDREPTDYLANDLGVRLCSARLRQVIDEAKGPDDVLQWLPVDVVGPHGRHATYYVLHLVTHPDVLDRQLSIVGRQGFVVRPVIDLRRVAAHRVFGFPGANTRLIVAESVRRAIETRSCTGIEFATVWLV